MKQIPNEIQVPLLRHQISLGKLILNLYYSQFLFWINITIDSQQLINDSIDAFKKMLTLRNNFHLGTAIEMMTTHQCSTNGHHTILHRPHQLQRQPGEQIQRQLHLIQKPADHLLYLQEQRLHIPLEIRFLRFSIKYLAGKLCIIIFETKRNK